MPKLAANLTMLFGEMDFLDRFEAAAEAGFRGVEFLFPYAYDAQTLKERLGAHRLEQVLHNLPAGNWAAGERGIACLPDRVDEFKAGVAQAIKYATALDCDRVNCLAGIPPPALDAATARQTFVQNLRYAAPLLDAAGITLLIEPINTRDIPGFFLSGTRQAIEIIDAVGSDNLWLQYDIYHMQIMEGDAAQAIERYLPRIAHMQLADVPGRHEPGTGQVDFAALFALVDRLAYDGWIGCEYVPQGGTLDGLAWAKPYL
ncbi:MAG: hydroxypyruvate isomerase [Acidobacteria bacterium]|nr:hydroxypyruvate isomerase [Acidobacteriota bacterium]